MTVSVGPNIPVMVHGGQGEAHYTEFMAFLRWANFWMAPVVKQIGLNIAPASPADGDAYIVGTSPTGTWAGLANRVARWSTVQGAWETLAPKQGWTVEDYATQASFSFNGTAWASTTYVDAAVVHKSGTETMTGLKTFAQGINLGGTANLNAYDEGTWTPTATNLGGTGIAYSTRWVRVGNVVHYTVVITGTGLSSTIGSTRLSLPFTPVKNSSGGALGVSGAPVQSGSTLSSTGGVVWLPTIPSCNEITVTGTIYLN